MVESPLAQLHLAVDDHLVIDVGLVVEVDSVRSGQYAGGQYGVFDELVNWIARGLLFFVVVDYYRHLTLMAALPALCKLLCFEKLQQLLDCQRIHSPLQKN